MFPSIIFSTSAEACSSIFLILKNFFDYLFIYLFLLNFNPLPPSRGRRASTPLKERIRKDNEEGQRRRSDKEQRAKPLSPTKAINALIQDEKKTENRRKKRDTPTYSYFFFTQPSKETRKLLQVQLTIKINYINTTTKITFSPPNTRKPLNTFWGFICFFLSFINLIYIYLMDWPFTNTHNFGV